MVAADAGQNAEGGLAVIADAGQNAEGGLAVIADAERNAEGGLAVIADGGQLSRWQHGDCEDARRQDGQAVPEPKENCPAQRGGIAWLPAWLPARPSDKQFEDKPAGQRVGRLGIEPRTRGLKVRCSAS
jgi:hypothetical protein